MRSWIYRYVLILLISFTAIFSCFAAKKRISRPTVPLEHSSAELDEVREWLMPVETAINHLHPRMTFVSHVLELSHPSNSPLIRRWSFDYALKRIKNIPETEAAILTWGERWLVPGTVLETE